MERRRMRRKPTFAKRMMVTMLSLALLLGTFSPGLMASAEDAVTTEPTQETGSFLDNLNKVMDEQTLSGTVLGTDAATFVAKFNQLRDELQALDPAAEDYAALVEALNAKIAELNALVASTEMSEADRAAVAAAAVGAVTPAGSAQITGGEELTERTVTADVNGTIFAITGKLPEGVTLSVVKLEDSLTDFIRSDVLNLNTPAGYTTVAYDVKLMLDGVEYQPTEPVNFGVTADGITSKSDVDVYHLPDTSAESIAAAKDMDSHGVTSEKIEQVNCYDAGYYAFSADGFSVYVAEYLPTSETAEKTYLERIAELKTQAEALDPEAEDYETQWWAIKDANDVIIDEATAAWEADEITYDEYAEIYYAYEEVNAALGDAPTGEVAEPSVLAIQPEAGATRNGYFTYGTSQLSVYCVDMSGASLTGEVNTATIGQNGITLKNYVPYITGYSHKYVITSAGVIVTGVRYQNEKLQYSYTVKSGHETLTYWKDMAADDYLMFVYTKGDNYGVTNVTGNSNYFDHLEVEIAATVNVYLDGSTEPTPVTVGVTTADSFTVTATYDGKTYANGTIFNYYGNTVGDGSTDSDTVELTGYYPAGTQSKPVIYTITLQKTITLNVNGTVLNIPVTLSVTTNYWNSNNKCPGVANDKDWSTSWEEGGFSSGAGIDVPVSAEEVSLAITKGKMSIEKVVKDESGNTVSPEDAFTFTIQHTSDVKNSSGQTVSTNGKYATFANGAYTGTSETVTDACKVTVTGSSTITLTDLPAGTYKIRELQSEGYIIIDAEGNAASKDYAVDYTVSNKTDTAIPVVTFTNKQLTKEAGISIRKFADGKIGNATYPNPTVSIYAVDTDGNKTGDAIWTGTLTANGDTLYLTKTLPAGTYIIEESGQTLVGYDCTTTISGGETVDGMKFTVVGGNRYDLVVSNVYVEKPKTTDITVEKLVSGNMGDQNKTFEFTATIVSGDTTSVPTNYSANPDGSFNFTLTHDNSVTFEDVPLGAVLTITELDVSAYKVTYEYDTDEGSKTETVKQKDAGTNAVSPEITVIDGLTVTVENNNNVSIDTGIEIDSFPFIIMLSSVIVMAAFFLIGKKRMMF